MKMTHRQHNITTKLLIGLNEVEGATDDGNLDATCTKPSKCDLG